MCRDSTAPVLLQGVQKSVLSLQRAVRRPVTHTLILSSVIHRRDREEHEHQQLTGHRRINAWAVVRRVRLAENKTCKDSPNPTERYKHGRRNSPFGVGDNVIGRL